MPPDVLLLLLLPLLHSTFVFGAQNGPITQSILYDRVADSAILGECFTELAKKYPATKFVKIISTECIPNYPDKNLPTVLIYKDTKCLQHLIGLGPFGGPRTTPERKFHCIFLVAWA